MRYLVYHSANSGTGPRYTTGASMGDSQQFIPRTTALAKNIEQVGYHDLNGKPGFQMAMQEVDGRYYIYSATFAHPGWHILDVTDPAKPDYVKWIDGPPLKGQG